MFVNINLISSKDYFSTSAERSFLFLFVTFSQGRAFATSAHCSGNDRSLAAIVRVMKARVQKAKANVIIKIRTEAREGRLEEK